MATLITADAGSITPHLVLGYQSVRTTGNVLHPIIGRSDVDVTFKAAGLRTGTLRLLVLTLAEALAAEALHASIGILRLSDTDLPALNMRYVPSGTITIALDEETRALWTVEIEFQEVA